MTGPTVFHYASAGAAIGIVRGQQIWASKVQHLNDEREYVRYLDAAMRVARSKFSRSESDEGAFLDDLGQTLESIARANVFVASFSERGDLLSQWRGYAPQGGYSFGFDMESLQVAFARQGLEFHKAIYEAPDESQLAEMLEQAFRNHRAAYDAHDHASGLNALRELAAKILTEAPKYKDPGFAEECEWRVISPLTDWETEALDVVDIRGRLRPILKVSLTSDERVANDSKGIGLAESFVSPGPDSDLRREALVLLLRRHGVPYGRISRSTIPYNSR